jgi:hypothetical protein
MLRKSACCVATERAAVVLRDALLELMAGGADLVAAVGATQNVEESAGYAGPSVEMTGPSSSFETALRASSG